MDDAGTPARPADAAWRASTPSQVRTWFWIATGAYVAALVPAIVVADSYTTLVLPAILIANVEARRRISVLRVDDERVATTEDDGRWHPRSDGPTPRHWN